MRRLLFLIALLVLALLAGLVLRGPGRGAHASAPVVTGKGGQVYEIRGRVVESSGCGDAGPRLGTQQRATANLELSGRTLTVSLGSVSEVFRAYSHFRGQLRADGSFVVAQADPLPANAGRGVLEGRLTETGAITGTWVLGLPVGPSHDPVCHIRLERLESSFYFGVGRVDWRREWRVR
jgi:hypothetical protein